MKKKGNKGGDQTPRETGHYRRYPEEAIIDELEAEEADRETAGAALAEEFSAVTGKVERTSGRQY